MAEASTKPTPELERLRAELEDAERRLRRANADFHEFVSRVSHDFREPLRTIAAYCQLLANKKEPDEDSDLYVRYILDGVERAQTLLAAMVEYASAEPEKPHPVPVDMNAVLFESVRRVAAGSEASITHDRLPVVAGDFDILSKVMTHLLDNAIKFSKRADWKVHVSAHQDGHDSVICVQDNGPGIDPAHSERVFGLFRRLHGRDIPGSGLGLAFARKAVEALGGRIWLESKPGEGARFCFALPAGDS